MQEPRESTEGEKIIEYYLEDQEIKFEREVEILNLLNDTKSCRRADFFLPKYKVYLEFLGKWNDYEKRQAYLEKMKVYELNDIPCVYIYPDNLGALDIIFRMRLQKQFEKYSKLSHQQLLFNFWKLKNVLGVSLAGCFGLALVLIVSENIQRGRLSVGILSIIIPTFFLVALLLYAVKHIFFKK